MKKKFGSQNIPYLFYFSEYVWRKFYHMYLHICTCTYKYVYVRAYLKNIDIFFIFIYKPNFMSCYQTIYLNMYLGMWMQKQVCMHMYETYFS